MITYVAKALGANLLNETAFVGGCTTGLLLTDEFTKETTRHTDDVDLIIDVVSKAGWESFRERLVKKGFTERLDRDAPNCALFHGELRVDFMPHEATVLGFSNRWYKQALKSAEEIALSDDLVIRVVSPVFFVATKLEAYLGRGGGDAMSSRDIEDILTLIDGREEIVEEIISSGEELKGYISQQLGKLMEDSNFEYAIQSIGDASRAELVYQRILAILGEGE